MPGLRGWLVVYIVALVLLTIHGLGLTLAAIIVYVHPSSVVGSNTSVSLPELLFYVVTNVALAAYTVILLVLMTRRRKIAIAHNLIFNLASILFLVSWHLLGEKSLVGTFIDSLPAVIGFLYISRSQRVRRTFVR